MGYGYVRAKDKGAKANGNSLQLFIFSLYLIASWTGGFGREHFHQRQTMRSGGGTAWQPAKCSGGVWGVITRRLCVALRCIQRQDENTHDCSIAVRTLPHVVVMDTITRGRSSVVRTCITR